MSKRKKAAKKPSKKATHKVSSLSSRKAAKRPKVKLPSGKRVPFRDIKADGVTYSFLSEWLQDREAARLSYVEGFTEAGVIDALEFGQLFHSCLETAAASRKPVSPSQIVRKYIIERERWSKVSAVEKAQIELLGSVVAVIFPLYEQFWKEQSGMEYRSGSEFVCQEESFKVHHEFERLSYQPIPMTGTFNKVVEQYQIPLRGRFDAVLRNGSTKRLWLMENKTKSNIDVEGLTVSLPIDTQTMMYCYSMRLLYNETPEGVLYNVVRRPQLRQGVKETREQYLKRIQDDVLARPQHYFMRWEVYITEQDLQDWLSRIFDPLMRDVVDWWESISQDPFNPWGSPRHYINPEGLYTRYGRSKYFDLYTRKTYYGLKRRDA